MLRQLKTDRNAQVLLGCVAILACLVCGMFGIMGLQMFQATTTADVSQTAPTQPPIDTPVPTPTAEFVRIKFTSKYYPNIDDLVIGVMGESRIAKLDYGAEPGRSGLTRYDVDVVVKSPEIRTRLEMLQISYVIAREFYYNFSDAQPAYISIHLRTHEDDISCVFGLGIGPKSIQKHLTLNPPNDLEGWFSDLVASEYYADLPGQSEEFMAYGNDPANAPLCKLDNWKN